MRPRNPIRKKAFHRHTYGPSTPALLRFCCYYFNYYCFISLMAHNTCVCSTRLALIASIICRRRFFLSSRSTCAELCLFDRIAEILRKSKNRTLVFKTKSNFLALANNINTSNLWVFTRYLLSVCVALEINAININKIMFINDLNWLAIIFWCSKYNEHCENQSMKQRHFKQIWTTNFK